MYSTLIVALTASNLQPYFQNMDSLLICLYTVNWEKHTKMFLSYLSQNPVDCDKIWYTVSWIILWYNSLDVFHLTEIMHLHYLVKLKIRVFVKISMLEKRNSRYFYLLTVILLIDKDATFWLWPYVMANLIGKTCTKLYQNRPRCIEDVTKPFWMLFSVHSSSCCLLAKCEC